MIASTATSEQTNSWMLALVFNALLILLPLSAVNLIVTGYTSTTDPQSPSAETLAETKRAMDQAFANITPNKTDARDLWADKIAEQLAARNMSAARGYLLAAPEMLNATDQRSIKAAAEAEPSGTADQRLLRAALLFVPSDIRVRYEATAIPRGTDLIEPTEDEIEDAASAQFKLAADLSQNTSLSSSLLNITSKSAQSRFSVLGTREDLVSRSRDWMRGNRQHAFELRLTGLAMATPPSATGLTQDELIRAASILKTAYRSDRLQTQYRRLLEQRLKAALPDAILEANLEDALAEVATLDVRAQYIQDAFAKSVNPRAAKRLSPELSQIADIVKRTSERGALELIVNANSAADISQARLIAHAGGDRAVALASYMGADVLKIKSTDLRWTRETVLNMIMLVAASIALILCVFTVVQRAILGPQPTGIL